MRTNVFEFRGRVSLQYVFSNDSIAFWNSEILIDAFKSDLKYPQIGTRAILKKLRISDRLLLLFSKTEYITRKPELPSIENHRNSAVEMLTHRLKVAKNINLDF